MADLTRRSILQFTAAGTAALIAGNLPVSSARAGSPKKPIQRRVKIRIGAMEGVVGGGGRRALQTAKKCGLQGVQADAGRPEEILRICKEKVIEEFRSAIQETGVAVSSICMGLLNRCPFVSDSRAPGWVRSVVDAAQKLGAKTILVPFFGRGALRTRSAMDKAAALAAELAPYAASKGITLGLENTLSAEDNLYILEKAGNPKGLKIYYDVGNSTRARYNVPKEIRLLGKRICEIHFKDYKNGILGLGEVDFKNVAEAMADIFYEGWIILETRRPLGIEITAAKNEGYIRGLFERFK